MLFVWVVGISVMLQETCRNFILLLRMISNSFAIIERSRPWLLTDVLTNRHLCILCQNLTLLALTEILKYSLILQMETLEV